MSALITTLAGPLLAATLAGTPPATPAAEPSAEPSAILLEAPKPAGIFKVADIRPGMDVIAYTVFQGDRVEPFRGRVLGVARNFFGPKRDIVLVDFHEDRVRHTGIVHGMSGSPVYIGDRVLGAVSLVLSPFPRDAIGGVTPLEYMLAEADEQPGGPPGEPGSGGANLHQILPPDAPRDAMLRPIGLPMVASGIQPGVLEHYHKEFAALGMRAVAAPGGSDSQSGLDGNDLRPGRPVSAVLADGDAALDATGTITWREGDRIFAFGHPFLQQGRVEFPMAPASVVATLADQNFAFKVTNVGRPMGTVKFDRMTAIVGDIGPVPGMIPMTVRITRDNRDIATYRYRVARNPWLTPALVQLLIANSLSFRWDYDEEATYKLRGTIRLADGTGVSLAETYAVAPDPRSATPFALAADVGSTFAQIWSNPFQPVDVAAIELRYDTLERGLMDRLEGVYLDPERARAGESASIRIAVRGLRGQRRITTLKVPIPAWAEGRRLALRVADSSTLRSEAILLGAPADRVASLEQLIDLLANRPRADRFYVQLLAWAPDATLHHKRLPSLPSSVAEVLERGGGPYRRLPRALVWEVPLLSEGVALGNQELVIEVRP